MKLMTKFLIGAAAVIIGAITWYSIYRSVTAWAADRALTSQRIAYRDSLITRQDSLIKRLDMQLLQLAHQNEILKSGAERAKKRVASSDSGWAEAKQRLEEFAATNAGLVPIENVRLAAHAADTAIASRDSLLQIQGARISNLDQQIVDLKEAGAHKDTVRVNLDANVADTKLLYKPPWWKRTASWVADHAVTVAITVVSTLAIERAVRP